MDEFLQKWARLFRWALQGWEIEQSHASSDRPNKLRHFDTNPSLGHVTSRKIRHLDTSLRHSVPSKKLFINEPYSFFVEVIDFCRTEMSKWRVDLMDDEVNCQSDGFVSKRGNFGAEKEWPLCLSDVSKWWVCRSEVYSF